LTKWLLNKTVVNIFSPHFIDYKELGRKLAQINYFMTDDTNAIVVEDYKLIADMWGELLKETGRFNHVQVLYTPEDLTSKIELLNPALILMDINLPGSKNGIEITKTINTNYPAVKIIILSIHDEPGMVKLALKNGALGYITKNSPISEMKKGIEQVLKGETYLCKEVAKYF
jgi:two-component system invasion response regulator UvrY